MMRMRLGFEGKINTIMSGTRFGKLTLSAVLLASFAVSVPLSAYAERNDEWWQRQKAKHENSSSPLPPTTTSNVFGSSKSGKAVTKTEVFTERVAPMVSPNSVSAM